MCGPAAGLLGAVGSIGSIGMGIAGANAKEAAQQQQYAYEIQATMEHNRRVMDNAQRANLAAGNQYSDIQQRKFYNSQALVQQAGKAVGDVRQAEGSVMASAASSGLGPSGSVSDIYNSYLTKEANINANLDTKFKDMTSAYNEQGKQIYAQAEDRINSMAMQAAPLAPASTRGLDIANSVVSGIGGIAKGLEGLGSSGGLNFGGMA